MKITFKVTQTLSYNNAKCWVVIYSFKAQKIKIGADFILKLPKIKFNKLIFSPTNEAARSASQRV